MVPSLHRHLPSSLFLGLLWLPLLWLLTIYWRSDAQYQYGWLVPPAVLFLLWQRWTCRPEPVRAQRRLNWAVIAGASLLYAPLWLVLAANTDWRPVCWALAAVVLLITFAWIDLRGGRTWTLHFAIPLLLTATAIPWPSLFETFVVHNLMLLVADGTVLLLDLFGVPARQVGILIETRHGMVGIEEACSGVRSLQAALTAALVFGELYRLRAGRRLGLVGIAFAAALTFNLLRALLLTLAASHGGVEAVDRFHDSAGFTILSACLLVLWWVTTRLQEAPPHRESVTASSAHRVSAPLILAIAAWLVVTLAGTEWWYRSRSAARSAALRVEWPQGAQGFAFDEVAPEIRAEIGSDIAESARWTDGAGRFWMAFYFDWPPGSRTGQLLARQHRPEICLPAVGTALVGERSPLSISANGEAVIFRAYTFDRYGRSLYVYFTRWEQTPLRGGARSGLGSLRHDRLQSVLEGRRRFGQQIVEVALAGAGNAQEADAILQETLPQLLRVEPDR